MATRKLITFDWALKKLLRSKANFGILEGLLIEVQYERELDYLQRILYATSRTLVEQMREGAPYSDLVKVISVNILYFDLGEGEDYVYRGRTHFRGLHKADELRLSPQQRLLFPGKAHSWEIFPEYQASMVESSYGIGRKEGIEEGKVEGKEEAAISMVRALKQQGVPLETIAFASGLSIEAIKKL